jgi:TolB-like protein
MPGQTVEEAIERFTDVLIAERELRKAQQKLDMTISLIPAQDRAFYWAETNQLRLDFEALQIGGVG